MIWYLLLNLILAFATLISGILPVPDAGVTAQITSQVTNFRNTIQAANWIFPVDATLGFLATILVIEGILILWHLARWVASMLSFGVVK